MHLATFQDPARFAEAWARVNRVAPVYPSETDAAMRLASAENIDFCEAMERVKAERYARQETLDGAYPSTDG